MHTEEDAKKYEIISLGQRVMPLQQYYRMGDQKQLDIIHISGNDCINDCGTNIKINKKLTKKLVSLSNT